MKAGAHPLWQELLLFRFDAHDTALPFSARLAKEERWGLVFAQRAIEEYRRFLFLMCVAEYPVTPSVIVDKVWHLHLCDTRSYWEQLCGRTVGRELHHLPTQGAEGDEEKFAQQYRQTLQSYREWFGKDPPRDLWPISEPRRKAPFRWTGEGVLALGIGVQTLLWSLEPPQWWRVDGPLFLWLFALGGLLSVVLALWLPRFKLIPLLALFGVGMVQLCAGVQRGFPVGYLTSGVFLNALVLIWMFWGIRKRGVAGTLLASGVGQGSAGAGGFITTCGGVVSCGSGGGGSCGGGSCGGGGCGGGGCGGS